MLSIKGKVDNLEGLNSYITKLEKYAGINNDELKLYLQEKCLNLTKDVAKRRLRWSDTTNVEYYEPYINNIRIGKSNEKGFDIISDLTIYKPETKHSHAYYFSISLAFEYGTGIVGMGTGNAPSWYQYNVNENTVIYNDEEVEGWWIPIQKMGNSQIFGISKSGKAVITQGYEAVEVFRFSAYEINANLVKWINDFYKKKGCAINVRSI